jgi:bifunctional DNA-binding transcriptional regulator/antitoxin component of YhaV-PrlF toxin-antitoxin module
MFMKVTSKRQVTFPARVLARLGVGPGDSIELIEDAKGFLLRSRRVDVSKLGTLKGKIGSRVRPFDIGKFRREIHDPSLRD